MALLFFGNADRASEWIGPLQQGVPGLEVRVYPDIGDPADIRYTLGFAPPPGVLKGLPNLQVMFSTGAGVDGTLRDPEVPAHVPLVRMVETGLTEGMTEYVVLHTLAWHRDLWAYAKAQEQGRWIQRPQTLARDRRVGILGLGVLGTDAARALSALRFDVAGWSRTPKHLDGVRGFAGGDGLDAFLARTEILICLLPLTSETRGLLDRRCLSRLPKGAVLINAARGAHVVDADLLALLDEGHLAGATLDVFHEEPLPADHPYWRHPKVVVTPHAAAQTLARGAAAEVARQIRRHQAGEPLENVVDRTRGY
ncbi:MAG TPA: glyoxylate/hydroxypyruvate reductase A [Azospirillaceae bacterium]|nr:glyoxylate/hydroxypyruvate reductase A [Azospirillaceae bacterium]